MHQDVNPRVGGQSPRQRAIVGRRAGVTDRPFRLPACQLVEDTGLAEDRIGIVARIDVFGKENIESLDAEPFEDLSPCRKQRAPFATAAAAGDDQLVSLLAE